MSTEKYGDMPPRPPLSVAFPLHLGDEFHIGSVEAVRDAANAQTPPAPATGREPAAAEGTEPGH